MLYEVITIAWTPLSLYIFTQMFLYVVFLFLTSLIRKTSLKTGLSILRITSYNVCYTKLLRLALKRNMCSFYYDSWNFCSDMELRSCSDNFVYDINAVSTYPRIKVTETIKRNGRITSYNVCYTKLLRFWLFAILSLYKLFLVS